MLPEQKDPITLLIENPNLAFCAILLQAVTFMAALASWDFPPKILPLVFLFVLNGFLVIVFGNWVLTGKRFDLDG